jgi:hypothetical protein
MRLHYWTKHNGSRQIDLHTGRGGYGIRLGRPAWVNFSERYQGQHGIPRRYWYALGGRVALVRLRVFVPEPHVSQSTDG